MLIIASHKVCEVALNCTILMYRDEHIHVCMYVCTGNLSHFKA